MGLHDPTAARVSACPVHFIWDGRGHGRAVVRAGFLGLLVAAMLAMTARLLHVDAVRAAAVIVLLASVAVWCVGQALSAVATRRARVAARP